MKILKRTSHRAKREEGFALLDTLIAVAVFATGLLGAVQFIGAMQNQLIFQRMELSANLVCMAKIEEIDAKDNYTPYVGSGAWTPAAGDYSSNQGNYGAYEYKVDGAELISGKCAKITVSVRYNFMGYNGLRTMTTVVMKKS